jgi:short subunit dehydrogenase-like uncharacterized protein
VNARGEHRVARVHVANGYDVTVHASLAIVKQLLTEAPAGGSYTPSRLAGKELVERLPGSSNVELSSE